MDTAKWAQPEDKEAILLKRIIKYLIKKAEFHAALATVSFMGYPSWCCSHNFANVHPWSTINTFPGFFTGALGRGRRGEVKVTSNIKHTWRILVLMRNNCCCFLLFSTTCCFVLLLLLLPLEYVPYFWSLSQIVKPRNGTPVLVPIPWETLLKGGGGFLRNRISYLKTPLGPNLKKGGGVGGGLRGLFAARGYCSREEHPGPANPPPRMKCIVWGTSEQLGMRPRCDPTIHTAPTKVYGTVSLAWAFPAVHTGKLGTLGLRGGHGVRNTPWRYKCSMGVETHQGWSGGSECIMGVQIHHGVRNASRGGHK